MSQITKLGMGIVAFEGTEHIKNIAYELRDSVDEIIVCLQEKSYTGVDIDQFDIDEVNRCLDAQLIDKVVWYKYTEEDVERLDKETENKEEVPRKLECEKRNQILDILEADGCSHAIVLDSDEFYDGEQFAKAKQVINNDPEQMVTYCQYLNYWQDYSHYLVWSKKTYVPFIADIKYRFSYGTQLTFAVDKTRVYGMNEGEDFRVLRWDFIHMHHLSWVRLDISKKIASWSSKKYYDQQSLDFIIDHYYKWKESDNAYVMFRVPLKPVCVVKYDRPYIHPHYVLFETNLDEYDV